MSGSLSYREIIPLEYYSNSHIFTELSLFISELASTFILLDGL